MTEEKKDYLATYRVRRQALGTTMMLIKNSKYPIAVIYDGGKVRSMEVNEKSRDFRNWFAMKQDKLVGVYNRRANSKIIYDDIQEFIRCEQEAEGIQTMEKSSQPCESSGSQ